MQLRLYHCFWVFVWKIWGPTGKHQCRQHRADLKINSMFGDYKSVSSNRLFSGCFSFWQASKEPIFSILTGKRVCTFLHFIKCLPTSQIFSPSCNATWPGKSCGSGRSSVFSIMEMRRWKARCFAERPRRQMALSERRPSPCGDLLCSPSLKH